MRKRKEIHHHTKEKAHELTADYFTIHSKTLRPASEDLSRIATSELLRLRLKADEEVPVEKLEITDIAALMAALKKSSVDREKLVAVRKFASEGGEELYYLPDRMPEIMSLLVFQSSRRQLLTDLLHRSDEARQRRDSLKTHVHDDADAQKNHDAANRNANNLMRAAQAADDQVKRLEYWSDIKGMAQSGDTLMNSEDGKQRWNESEWSGLTVPSGPNKESFTSKQTASAGMPRLHEHAEHSPEASARKQQGREDGPPRKTSSLLLDVDAARRPRLDAIRRSTASAIRRPGRTDTDEPKLERFTTAPEAPPTLKSLSSEDSEGSRTPMDGADDEEDAPPPPLDHDESATDPRESDDHQRSRSVQLVDPVRDDERGDEGAEAAA